MNTTKLNQRNPSMDIIRIIAVFSVLSVHLFLNIEFYSEPVLDQTMYIGCLMRTLFGICVPLFILLTGFLMSQKTLSARYYRGLQKTLTVYLLASIACILFKNFYLKESLSFKDGLSDILCFRAAPYAWYIEMYIGLFLLIPFLNLIYNNLQSQKQKKILIGTFFLLTTFPSLLNIYNFSSMQWWITPSISDSFTKLVPDWWLSIYPITYYFVGCYLHEYGLKYKTRTLIVFFLVSIFAFGSFNFYRSYNGTFQTTFYNNWYGFQPFIMAILLFELIRRWNTNGIKPWKKWTLSKLSDLALSIYLISYIFDAYFYPKYATYFLTMSSRLYGYTLIVPLIFLCSTLASCVLMSIAKAILFVTNKLLQHFEKSI